MKIFRKNKKYLKEDHSIGDTSNKGLIFIPDISGFTELVKNTDMVTGKNITFELLSTILKNNKLKLEVAEIEGDAVLFFKCNQLPSIIDIVDHFEILKIEFTKTKIELEEKYERNLKIDLKAIAHYGTITEFFLGGFRKLYGEVVVEAHHLLKNKINESSYLLITNELIESSIDIEYANKSINGLVTNKLCEIYNGLRNICYSYILTENSFKLTPEHF